MVTDSSDGEGEEIGSDQARPTMVSFFESHQF